MQTAGVKLVHVPFFAGAISALLGSAGRYDGRWGGEFASSLDEEGNFLGLLRCIAVRSWATVPARGRPSHPPEVVVQLNAVARPQSVHKITGAATALAG